MATSRSAKKNIRKARKHREVNRANKATLRSMAKRVTTLVEAKSAPEAGTALRELQAKLDKGAQRGTIHKNKAARKKSRLQKRLNALAKAPKA